MSPSRKWLFRLIALVVVPLVFLGGFELVLRIAGYGYPTGFFKKVRVGEKDFLINNESFSLRFFPPQLARVPGPVMMPAVKPPNTYRIFILGESAARGEPEPSYAASRYLEVLLDGKFTNTHFEVVNLGITAINSHVILPIARDCARADGDLWLIYMGNNEMVGPFGAATVFGAKSPPLPLVRLILAIQETRVGQWLMAIGRAAKRETANEAWGGMKMFIGNQLAADDPRREVVYQNFARNLDDILKLGLDSGAKILLNTVAVNLKDSPPFASLTNRNLNAADRAQFDQFYASAQLALAQSNYSEAQNHFASAAKLDPGFAELQYDWAQCSLAAGNLVDARRHYQQACDADALPFRADSRINSAIINAAQKFASAKLVGFDAVSALAKETPSGVNGQETFYEHVHFSFDGNFRLGRAWAEQVGKMLPAEITHAGQADSWFTQEHCDELLALTDWNRGAVTAMMLDRLQHPPMSTQANHAQRMAVLRQQENEFRQRISAASTQAAFDIYLAAIRRAPNDHWLHENFAQFLESTGDVKSAIAQWQMVEDLLPFNCMPAYHAGRLFSQRAQWPEAETELTRALTLRPRLAEDWYELGNVHLGTEKFAVALQDYQRASKLDPPNATYCAYEGKALSRLNRHTEAVAAYRRAIELKPDLWEPHFALGDELAAAGQLAGAAREYAQVVQLRPRLAMAHLDHGVMLARLGQYDEARQEFQETLRLDPDNQPAREYSAQVEVWKKSGGWPTTPINNGR